MREITKIILDYYKKNNYDVNEIAKDLEDIRLEVLDEYLQDENEYVIKRRGNIEEYDSDKMMQSIKNAAHESDYELTESDIKIISTSILKRMKSIKRNIYPTSEIKQYVIDSLKEDGYNKILESYLLYIKK
jgi:transcriptional regulator NrdR family protein